MVWTIVAAMLATALAAIPGTSVGRTGHGVTFSAAAPSTQARQIPANAFAVGDRWVCNDGYRRVGDACLKIDVPANAHAIGGAWVCNFGYRKVAEGCEKVQFPANARPTLARWVCTDGYRKVGGECLEIDVPDNAFPIGGLWACSLGFRRQDEGCVPMPEAKRQEQLERLLATAPRDSTMTPEVLWKLWVAGGRVGRTRQTTLNPRVGNYGFSLQEVAWRCRVYRASEEYGTLECGASSGWRPEEMRRNLEFQRVMRSCGVRLSGSSGAELVCADPQLAVVQWRCRAIMTAGPYGRITCS